MKRTYPVFLCAFLFLLLLLCGCGIDADAADMPSPDSSAASCGGDAPADSTVLFPNGVTADPDAESLDLTGLKSRDVDAAIEALALLPQLKEVNLGSKEDGLSPKAALRFRDAYPEIDFSYHCRLLGKDSVLDETRLDLSEIAPARIFAGRKVPLKPTEQLIRPSVFGPRMHAPLVWARSSICRSSSAPRASFSLKPELITTTF